MMEVSGDRAHVPAPAGDLPRSGVRRRPLGAPCGRSRSVTKKPRGTFVASVRDMRTRTAESSCRRCGETPLFRTCVLHLLPERRRWAGRDRTWPGSSASR